MKHILNKIHMYFLYSYQSAISLFLDIIQCQNENTVQKLALLLPSGAEISLSGGTVRLFQNTPHHLNPTEMKHHQICTSCFPSMQSTLSL
jgi:hypothetical protein